MDYVKLAESVDEIREAIRAIISALMDDGFSEEQARELVVAMWKHSAKGDDQ